MAQRLTSEECSMLATVDIDSRWMRNTSPAAAVARLPCSATYHAPHHDFQLMPKSASCGNRGVRPSSFQLPTSPCAELAAEASRYPVEVPLRSRRHEIPAHQLLSEWSVRWLLRTEWLPAGGIAAPHIGAYPVWCAPARPLSPSPAAPAAATWNGCMGVTVGYRGDVQRRCLCVV